jgi:hypothetical protein
MDNPTPVYEEMRQCVTVFFDSAVKGTIPSLYEEMRKCVTVFFDSAVKGTIPVLCRAAEAG